MIQYCQEPNGNTLSLSSSIEVSHYSLLFIIITLMKILYNLSVQKHDFLEPESSTSDSDMKDIDLNSSFYNISNQFPV